VPGGSVKYEERGFLFSFSFFFFLSFSFTHLLVDEALVKEVAWPASKCSVSKLYCDGVEDNLRWGKLSLRQGKRRA
jgi:hypothetical protein